MTITPPPKHAKLVKEQIEKKDDLLQNLQAIEGEVDAPLRAEFKRFRGLIVEYNKKE